MLSEWYVFTLNNAAYAAALAIAVWLLTAMFYSIRIAAIKRRKAAGEKNATHSLNAMQQQLQQSQEALAETVEQMEKAQHAAQDETQRALTLEQLIYQRNQQIAGTIQMLATSFDLGERPQLATEDVKADSLWQQHEKVITQLIERLRTEMQAKIALQQTFQAETAKLAEKEALLKTLQTTLDNHSSQLGKLEQALAEQKSMLQQQNDGQRALSDSLKNFQPAVAPAVAQEPVNPVNTWQQPIPLEQSPTIADAPVAQPVLNKELEEIHEEPQAAVALATEETPIERVMPVEAVASVPPETKPQPAAIQETSVEPLDMESQAVTPAKGSFGKFTNLFGKQPAPEIKPQSTVEEEAPSVSADIEQEPAAPAKGSFGKMKNLFGKKPQAVKTEPQWSEAPSDEKEAQPVVEEQQPENEAPEKAENKPGKLKGFYSKFASKGK